MNVEDNALGQGTGPSIRWGGGRHKTLGQKGEKHLPLFPSWNRERRDGDDR